MVAGIAFINGFGHGSGKLGNLFHAELRVCINGNVDYCFVPVGSNGNDKHIGAFRGCFGNFAYDGGQCSHIHDAIKKGTFWVPFLLESEAKISHISKYSANSLRCSIFGAVLRQLLHCCLGLLLLPACLAQKKLVHPLSVKNLPAAHAARQFGYEMRQGESVSTVLVQVMQPGPEAYAMSLNHDGKLYRVQWHPSQSAGSRSLAVAFSDDSAALFPAALMFRLSDTLLNELLHQGHTHLDLVKPYRAYEADGRAQIAAEVLASLSIHACGDTLLPVSCNGSEVLLKCRMAEGESSTGRFRLFFSGTTDQPLLLGWDFQHSVRLTWIDLADIQLNPLLLQPGSSLLFLYNHPVMYQGLWDYMDDSLWLYVERADSLLQGRYQISGKGSYSRSGRFFFESGRGDDPVMRLLPEYSMEDCARFGLVCGNWFLHGAQWNALMNRAVVPLEVNEHKDVQWFSPVLNDKGNFAFSRLVRMRGVEQEIRVLRLKDRHSETVMDVLPNSDYPMLVYWQEGTESLELKEVFPPVGKRKR